MMSKITKETTDNRLFVEVSCHRREFASHEIKLLTTDKILDILSKEYKIIKTIKEPAHKVGNSISQRIKLTGQWVFELEQEKKRKPRTRKKQTENPTSPGIRSRMSKIAQTERD